MKKAVKTKIAEPRRLAQSRPYSSRETMRVDAEQFMSNQDSFRGKLPRPGDWRLKVKVLSAVMEFGNPPEKKHNLHLDIEVQGTDKDIDAWQQECVKMFTPAKRDSVSSELGRRYQGSQRNA